MDSKIQPAQQLENQSFFSNFGRRNIILISAVITVLVVIAILVSQMIAWNEADERLVHQSAFTGNLTVINQAGPYFKAFGTVSAYKKVISINFTGDRGATASALVPLIPIRFLDTTTGDAKGVSRFRLPGNVPSAESGSLRGLLKIHEEFGSQETLISNLLMRATTENVKASARMMSVEQHYSGGNGQLSQDFSDQLVNGIFVTEQIFSNTGRNKTQEFNNLSKQQRVTINIKQNAEGKPLRNAPILGAYGITVVDASIIDIEYESKVNARLEAQKQAAADEALARQNLKKAEQQARTEVALGEQAIAKQRAESEKLKIKEQIDAERVKANAIISAQQRVAVKSELAKEQAEILKQQRLEAQGMDVLAEARQRAKSAALDPKYVFDETLKAEVQIQTALFNSLGNSRLVPEIVIGGSQGGQNNGSEFMRLLAADAALNLKKRLDEQK
ncbi:SPFH domain-containing protein [Shewanella sp. 3_MG-2023]|uniref:SPFH domain-containing protein n=1 Tax=Shewanella sp. 3_MG-2023 TaxID=3062635 RepID=UPI0026E1CB38|nr:SPFH domain-containing protein [Shewanella sp. 3_MG-2023]MDO6774318.1 SPFH domain-containing protein [Shewanella sp. 3_MG-2023]